MQRCPLPVILAFRHTGGRSDAAVTVGCDLARLLRCRLLRLRVVRLDGKPVGLWWALIRTLLLLAVVPPLIFDSDLRGLHDKAANTLVIRI